MIDKNKIFTEIKILQCFQNVVVVSFNDVIRIANCALNIELTQPVPILTFELTFLVAKSKNLFFTSEKPKKYHAWSCQNVCDALTFLLENIFIRFGAKLYRQVVGIPMGTDCAPLVADLFLFCYERDFMMSLSDD